MKRLALLGMSLIITAVVAAVIWRSLERQQEIPNAVVGSGVVEVDEVDVASEISGRLVQILVDEGDNVRAGQVIASWTEKALKRQWLKRGRTCKKRRHS